MMPERVEASIRIKVIEVRHLIRFTEEFFRNSAGQVIAPISRQRAVGMAHNPFADPHDPGLIVAYDDEKVIAHWGIVPGLLKTREGTSKVLWGSALFVHPNYRARGVLLAMIRTIFSFKADFIISGFTGEVYQIYRALGFRELKPLGVCYFIIFRLDPFRAALSLARRVGVPETILKVAGILTPVTRVIMYRPLRVLYLRWLVHAARKELAGIAFREVRRVQPAAVTPPSSPHFVRGDEGVNWMLEHPWVLENKTSPSLASDPACYFSDLRDSFRHYAIEFDDRQGRLAGYLAFSIQMDYGRRTLKLTDFNVRNKKDLSIVFWIAALQSARHRVDLFEAESAISPFMTEAPLGRFLFRLELRRYLYHAVKGGRLEKVFSELTLQYSDGDCAFT